MHQFSSICLLFWWIHMFNYYPYEIALISSPSWDKKIASITYGLHDLVFLSISMFTLAFSSNIMHGDITTYIWTGRGLGSTNTSFRVLYMWPFYVIIFQELLMTPCSYLYRSPYLCFLASGSPNLPHHNFSTIAFSSITPVFRNSNTIMA